MMVMVVYFRTYTSIQIICSRSFNRVVKVSDSCGMSVPSMVISKSISQVIFSMMQDKKRQCQCN